MTELKTLKDFWIRGLVKIDGDETDESKHAPEEYKYEVCYKDELKQEAIKWMKYWKRAGFKDTKENLLFVAWKNFFNLTEDDIKEEK